MCFVYSLFVTHAFGWRLLFVAAEMLVGRAVAQAHDGLHVRLLVRASAVRVAMSEASLQPEAVIRSVGLPWYRFLWRWFCYDSTSGASWG